MDSNPTPSWRKSSKCANGTCVEVAATDGGILMRDNKQTAGPVLSFDRGTWVGFLDGLRAGGFDRP